MTSDSDDLEQQLRQNLKLRRELAAEVAAASGQQRETGRWLRLPLGLGSLLDLSRAGWGVGGVFVVVGLGRARRHQ